MFRFIRSCPTRAVFSLVGWAFFAVITTVTLLSIGACQLPVHSVQLILDRHQQAMEKLPAAQRSQLMPYGTAVLSERVDELLPGRVLTRERARAIAIRGNPDVHAAYARLDLAAGRIAEAKARFFPTVSLAHNSTRTFQVPASPNPLSSLVQPSITTPNTLDASTTINPTTALINALRRPLFNSSFRFNGDRNSFSIHSTFLAVTWTAFDGLVRDAQLRMTKHLYRAATSEVVDVQRLIIQAVDSAYFQVQLAIEQLRIARADEVFSKEQYEETAKLHTAGRATQADVDNFRVRVLAAQANVVAAKGLRETGRVVLAELMGLAEGTLSDSLSLSPLAKETQEEMAAPEPATWISRALTKRPDLEQLQHMVQSEKERVRTAKGAFRPDVVMSGSWGFDRGSNLNYGTENQSSLLAVELRWDLFTGGARRARLRQAQASQAEAQARLTRRRLQIQSEVRRAIIDVGDAQEQIRLKREALVTARENRRVIQAGYLAGMETLTRLNEAQRDFISADADLSLARVRLRQAWNNLRAAAAAYQLIAPGKVKAKPQPASPK